MLNVFFSQFVENAKSNSNDKSSQFFSPQGSALSGSDRTQQGSSQGINQFLKTTIYWTQFFSGYHSLQSNLGQLAFGDDDSDSTFSNHYAASEGIDH